MKKSDDLEVIYKKTNDDNDTEVKRFTPYQLIRWVFWTLLICFAIVYAFHDCSSCNLGKRVCHSPGPFAPQQLHLSLGQNDSEYHVTWSTDESADTYLVWNKISKAGGTVPQWVLGEKNDEEMTTDGCYFNSYKKISYRAKMLVEPGSSYEYWVRACTQGAGQCQIPFSFMDATLKNDYEDSEIFTSETYQMTAKKFEDHNRELNIAFYGDLGLLNGQSIPRITQDVKKQKYDLIIHNGDFAYDLDTLKGRYGDLFMRLIEPIAARVPYQTSVGNHEIAHNFSEYNHRFTMINRGGINHGQMNNFFYSFNAGPVHFVAISTEFYYFLDYVGMEPLVNQYDWLKNDLALASNQRSERPWIIVFGHRPMYCSSRDKDDCSKDNNLLRKGLPFTGAFALEKLFYDFGVDIEIYSHEHQYERFLPIYDGKVFNGSDESPYHNPRAPVHIISGSAGCQERLDPFKGKPATGSIKRVVDYGYSRMTATKCQLRFSQISDDQNGTVVDEFTITKDRQNFPEASDIAYLGC